jgi:hypothetical protein
MVWFKWPKVTPAQLTASNEAAKKLAQIEGVLEVEFGTNFTDRSKDFNLSLFVRFTDKAALDYYGPHPTHEAFKATVAEKEDVMALDFEVGAL